MQDAGFLQHSSRGALHTAQPHQVPPPGLLQLLCLRGPRLLLLLLLCCTHRLDSLDLRATSVGVKVRAAEREKGHW